MSSRVKKRTGPLKSRHLENTISPDPSICRPWAKSGHCECSDHLLANQHDASRSQIACTTSRCEPSATFCQPEMKMKRMRDTVSPGIREGWSMWAKPPSTCCCKAIARTIQGWRNETDPLLNVCAVEGASLIRSVAIIQYRSYIGLKLSKPPYTHQPTDQGIRYAIRGK